MRDAAFSRATRKRASMKRWHARGNFLSLTAFPFCQMAKPTALLQKLLGASRENAAQIDAVFAAAIIIVVLYPGDNGTLKECSCGRHGPRDAHKNRRARQSQ